MLSLLVFDCKTKCSVFQHLELEDRDEEWNDALKIQREISRNLLHPLDAHESIRSDGICPRVLVVLVEVLTKVLSNIYQ